MRQTCGFVTTGQAPAWHSQQLNDLAGLASIATSTIGILAMDTRQQILFATNRILTSMTAGMPGFGDEPMPPGAVALHCATATVEGIDIKDENSGTIVAVSQLSQGGFATADLAPLLASKNDILVFIHGTANDFETAITRTAYNHMWLSKAVLSNASSTFDMITFTWPARGYAFDNPIAAIDDYEHDRGAASASGAHIAQFLKLLLSIRAKTGGRRMNLLCHSMGNYVLGAGVELYFADPKASKQLLFDDMSLAAADEIATTFTAPRGGRLSNLRRLGHDITVYYNRGDLAMWLSRVVNWEFHLGYDGPPNKADVDHFFPRNVYDFVDCDGLTDYISQAADHTHQYYRESPTVRADIAASLAGLVPQRAKYDATGNFYAFK